MLHAKPITGSGTQMSARKNTRTVFYTVFALALLGNGPANNAPAATELVARPGELVAATIEGAPARLRVVSGEVDRLFLNADYVARSGIKPAPFIGNGSLNIAGRRAFKLKNRPLDFVIGGMAQKGRAFWIADAPAVAGDGSIGPWALPHARVTLQFGDTDTTSQRHDFPLFGNISSQSVTGYKEASFGVIINFDLDDNGAYPLASAAAGAAIARAYGGTLSGASWDVNILLGVMRPVRLMTLERPLVIGPLSIKQFAVRVRDRIDGAGRGEPIPDGTEDPSEIVVPARKKGPRPYFTLSIPRATMAACSRLTFDKAAVRIELWCRPG